MDVVAHTDRMQGGVPSQVARFVILLIGLALIGPGGPIAWGQMPEVPEGFRIRLVAAVPAVEYPSQIATAPDGSLFVAEDPMDQVGPYEADHGRILRFPPGPNAEPTVFAEGFRAIFGMAWHDGALYVMNMPRLTVLRDDDGDGRADRSEELFDDLGLPASPRLNDHIVSGLQFGIDGRLYISVGDKGVPKATGPDGRTVQLVGGGILRCNPDGTELEVFTSGTRNHLEPNLDAADNLFTYDNTDDGDGWWTRVTHHIDSGYYGYPYDYHDFQYRMLPPMGDYGGGSPCGGVVYCEDIWPERFHGMALWAEWGKRAVRGIRFRPEGSTFQIDELVELVKPGPVGDFRPIDLALSHDGTTLYIADWSYGGWNSKDEKVGRVYAVTYEGDLETTSPPRGRDDDPIADQIAQLSHPTRAERIRAQHALIRLGSEALGAVTAALADPETPPLAARHLVWTLDAIAPRRPESAFPILEALQHPEADVRAQAARALGIQRVPLAVDPLQRLLDDPNPSVQLQAVIALGRIGQPGPIPSLIAKLGATDRYLAFAARQAIRRIDHWDAVADGLDAEDRDVRIGLLETLEMVDDVRAAELLAAFASDPVRPIDERVRALELLAQSHRLIGPWDGRWWGTRPTRGRPFAKDVEWDGTPIVVGTVLDRLLDEQSPIREAAIEAAQVIGDPTCRAALRDRLVDEPDENNTIAIVEALATLGDRKALPMLADMLRNDEASERLRESALTGLETIGGSDAAPLLIGMLERGEIAPERQPRVIGALARAEAEAAVPLLVEKLQADRSEVRLSAVEALGVLGDRRESVRRALRDRLDDPEVDVRRAAIEAGAQLNDVEAVPVWIAAADQEPTRRAALLALTSVPDLRALGLYLQGLEDRNPEMRRACGQAIAAIRDRAAPALQRLADRGELPVRAIPELQRAFAVVQPIRDWQLLGPFAKRAQPPMGIDPKDVDLNAQYPGKGDDLVSWQAGRIPEDAPSLNLARIFPGDTNRSSAFALATLNSERARTAEVLVGSDDTLTIWVNGALIYNYRGTRGFEPDQARLEVALEAGPNTVLARCGNEGGPWEFRIAVAAEADYPFLHPEAAPTIAFDAQRYRQVALEGRGRLENGRALFHDLDGLACIKCHVVDGQGGAIGPAMTGIAAKYPRDELITAILEPSAKISSGYEAVLIATLDGQILSGILKGRTDQVVEIEDADGRRIRIPTEEIEAMKPSDVSLMPAGLAEGLTADEFADLISYLETLREPISEPAGTDIDAKANAKP